MLVDITFDDEEARFQRLWRPDLGLSEEEFRQGIRTPKRFAQGVYAEWPLEFLLREGETSHVLVDSSPYQSELNQLPLRDAFLRLENGHRSDYGTADDIDQILAYYREEVANDPVRMYVIGVTLITAEHDIGFRFHKNGPYIGTRHEIDAEGDRWLPEHIEECTRMSQCILFNLMEVKPRE